MSCYDELTGGLTKNCNRPIKAGIKRKGFAVNVGDVLSWINTGTKKQFAPILKPGKTAFPIEVLGTRPFAGSNVASEIDDFTRDFTKTLVFNLPQSGALAAERIEEMTKSQEGFIFFVEGKDSGGDANGTFLIFGKDEPLLCSVAKDYIEGVASPVITATSKEASFENFLFNGDLATTKATFDALYSGDLTRRIYHLEAFTELFGAEQDEEALKIKITLLYGTPPSGNGKYVAHIMINDNGASSSSRTEILASRLSGESVLSLTDLTAAGYPLHVVFTMVERVAEEAGNPIYFNANLARKIVEM